MFWILLFFSLLGFRAQADDLFFMEPYVGFSKLEVQAVETDYKDISDNFIIGVRSGVKIAKSILLGLDYHAGGPYKFGTLLNRGSWSTKSLGAVIGVDYKVIRFWYGVYPNTEIDDTVNKLTYKGNAHKYGFSLALNQKLRVNIELMNYEVSAPQMNSPTSQSVTYKPKETNAYISVPVDF